MDDKNSSWRQIHQQLFSPAITPVAQRRRRFATLKRVGVAFAIFTAIFGLAGTVIYLRANSQTFAPYAQPEHKTQLEFFSDGQLTADYFQKVFPSLQKKALLTIDIASVQAHLLKNPQIKSATVERYFPATLKVTLRERTPIARVKLRLDGKTETYYLSPDGTFFRSTLYKPATNLPYITGAKISQNGPELSPLDGAFSLAEILDTFKSRFPSLSPLLSSINLTDWVFPSSGQTFVALKLRNGATLRFGPEKVSQQIERLAEVVRLLQDEKDSISNKLIDLTYPDKVAIVGNR